MKKIKVSFFLLFGILILSALLRFYKIDQVPVSLYWDEAAIAYNAYSIAETGKDEFGNSFPILFRSFNDYKLPGYIYTSAFFIKILGLSEFSARASAAFFGVATVFIIYFFIEQLFLINKKLQSQEGYFIWNPSVMGLLVSFLVAISPWHLQFSRTGFEANIGLFFIILGAWCFLKGLFSYHYYLLSMVSFAVSMYMYRSIHVFLPLLLVGFFVIYRNKLTIKKCVIGTILLVLLISPLLPHLFSQEGMKRAKQVDITLHVQDVIYENSLEIQKKGNTLLNRIIYNRRLIYIQEFGKNYISHFTPKFLFFEGDINDRHGPRGMGLLYYWELPFLLIGLYVLFKYAPSNAFKLTVLLWILLAPIPASLSIPSPHALRSLNIIPMPQLLIAMALVVCYAKFFHRQRLLFILVVSFFIVFCFVNYLYLYYVKTAKVTASAWADGYKQLTTYVFRNEDKYDKVVITGEYWQPYIYFLFHKKYSPEHFQKNGTNRQFDKYIFGGTSWDKEQYSQTLERVDLGKLTGSKNVLVILSPKELIAQKNNLKKIAEIYNTNNERIFVIGELQ